MLPENEREKVKIFGEKGFDDEQSGLSECDALLAVGHRGAITEASQGKQLCLMQLGSFLKCEKKSLFCNVEYSWSCCFDMQTDTLKVIKMPRLRGKFFIPAKVHATLFDHFFVFSF